MRVGAAPAARPPPAAGAAGVLHADSYGQGQAGGKVAVSDLSQKAAKALSSGTKWFMKASKTLVSQVQQRLDHGHGGAAGSGGSPRARAQGEPAPRLVAARRLVLPPFGAGLCCLVRSQRACV